MIPRMWIIGGGLALLVASNVVTGWKAHGWGYDKRTAEYRDALAKTQADLFREAEALSARAVELQQAEDDLSIRAREAEDAARRDPDVCRTPAPDSLRRLERRWAGAANP
jgi:hypothetical protein